MTLTRTAFAAALFCCATTASAQTSNCMRMGSEMVHCNSSDGSSTDCMRIGSDMATCNTIGGATNAQSYDSGAILGQGLGSLIASMQEKSFRKKVGKMMAEGDCEGAANYALTKGRLEIGTSIKAYCAQQLGGAAQNLPVEARIAQIASQAQTGVEAAPNLWITNVEARGRQLVLSAENRVEKPSFTLSDKEKLIEEFCVPQFEQIFREGGSVRADFYTAGGIRYASAGVDAEACGLS
jgi:hypothetical protein